MTHNNDKGFDEDIINKIVKKTEEKGLIREELKPFFEIAKKKGWKQGQHIFNFLTEIEMIQYDNKREEIIRKDEQQKAESRISTYQRIISDMTKRMQDAEYKCLMLEKKNKATIEKIEKMPVTMFINKNTILEKLKEKT